MTFRASAFFRLVSGLGDLCASTSSSNSEDATASSAGFDDDEATPLPRYLFFSTSALVVFIASALDDETLVAATRVRHAGLVALASATSESSSPSAPTEESDR